MHYRKKKGISLDELARRSGVSKSMLSQIEQENQPYGYNRLENFPRAGYKHRRAG